MRTATETATEDQLEFPSVEENPWSKRRLGDLNPGGTVSPNRISSAARGGSAGFALVHRSWSQVISVLRRTPVNRGELQPKLQPKIALFASHPGRRCRQTPGLFSRHPGRHCRPLTPRLAFPMLCAVMLTAGCASGPPGVSIPHPSPQAPPAVYAEPSSSYVPYRPDSAASTNQPRADMSTFIPVPPVSVLLLLLLAGTWITGPTLGSWFVDWLRERRTRRIEVFRR